jgi:hypothetical protein
MHRLPAAYCKHLRVHAVDFFEFDRKIALVHALLIAQRNPKFAKVLEGLTA